MRRSIRLFVSEVQHTRARRRWEAAVAGAVQLEKDAAADRQLSHHQRVYQQKNFVRVEDAFPLSDAARWSALPLDAATAKPKPPPAKDGAERCVAKIAIVGPPNAGKSTLLNVLASSHVSAASPTEGTTKGWVKGISTVSNTQLVMLDTPGVFHVLTPKDRERHLGHTFAAWDALMTADVCVLVLPAGLGYLEKAIKAVVKEVLYKAEQRGLPVVLVINKIDAVKSPSQQHLYKELRAEIDGDYGRSFSKIFEVSAKNYKGVLDLKDFLCRYGKPAEWKYFPHQHSDMNIAERCAELLSELCFKHLPSHVSQQMAHKVIGWTDSETAILADIELYFQQPGHMYCFYGVMKVVVRSLERELLALRKKKVRVRLHPLVAPGGIRK